MVFSVSEEELEEVMHELEEEDAKPKKSGFCGSACKRFMRMSFSSVGLCVLLTLYCVGGAFLFKVLEWDNEEKLNIAQYEKSEEVINETEHLKWILKQYKLYSDDADLEGNKTRLVEIQKLINASVETYHTYIADSVKNKTYAGTLEKVETPDWNFPACLLFTVSTVTVIGYGHLAPATEIGQEVCILYCIVGIPLTLMFLANVGDGLALGIRWTWGKVSAYKRRKAAANEGREVEKIETKDIQVPIVIILSILLLYVLCGTIIYKYWEDWSFVSSLYFVMATLTTIGFGDLVPGIDEMHTIAGQMHLAFSSLYIVFGLAFLSMTFNLMIEKVSSAAKNATRKLQETKEKRAKF